MKKVHLIVLSIMFIFILTACGTNTPTGKTEEYLSRYSSLNDDVKRDIDTTVTSAGLSTTNQDKYRSVLERQYKNIKYEVKDEEVDGNEATVRVKVTVYDLYKSDQTSLDYLANNTDQFYVDNVMDQEKYDTYRLDNMLDITETIDYDIEFYLTKQNGTWIVQNPNTATLEKIHGLYNYEG